MGIHHATSVSRYRTNFKHVLKVSTWFESHWRQNSSHVHLLHKIAQNLILSPLHHLDMAKINRNRCKTSGPGCSKRRYLNELVKGHFVNCFSRFNIR